MGLSLDALARYKPRVNMAIAYYFAEMFFPHTNDDGIGKKRESEIVRAIAIPSVSPPYA